jgi:hypothetical protein
VKSYLNEDDEEGKDGYCGTLTVTISFVVVSLAAFFLCASVFRCSALLFSVSAPRCANLENASEHNDLIHSTEQDLLPSSKWELRHLGRDDVTTPATTPHFHSRLDSLPHFVFLLRSRPHTSHVSSLISLDGRITIISLFFSAACCYCCCYPLLHLASCA